MSAPKGTMKKALALKAPAKSPVRGKRASAPGQVKKVQGLRSAAPIAKASRPIVPAGRKLPQTSGGPSFEALVRKTTADRKKLLPQAAKPAAQDNSPFAQIGRAIGGIFPAGRSNQIKNATTTYGKVDQIVKNAGKR